MHLSISFFVTDFVRKNYSGKQETSDGEEDNRNSPGFDNEEKDQKETHSEAENVIVGDQNTAGGIKGSGLIE